MKKEFNHGFIAGVVYTEEVNERVFTPPYWISGYDLTFVENNVEIEWIEQLYELTKEGREYLDEYLEDESCGYDLCYGRGKGLADRYTHNEFFELLKDSREYSKQVYTNF